MELHGRRCTAHACVRVGQWVGGWERQGGRAFRTSRVEHGVRALLGRTGRRETWETVLAAAIRRQWRPTAACALPTEAPSPASPLTHDAAALLQAGSSRRASGQTCTQRAAQMGWETWGRSPPARSTASTLGSAVWARWPASPTR